MKNNNDPNTAAVLNMLDAGAMRDLSNLVEQEKQRQIQAIQAKEAQGQAQGSQQ